MRVLGLLALAGLAAAGGLFEKKQPEGSTTRIFKRNGATVTIFEHAETGSTLEFTSNPGLCEENKQVKQFSGYLSVGANMNMWFWFFEARKDPEKAPLAAWFNGGPGCSSMIGLFQEHGPCSWNNGEAMDKPSNNPYSWNDYANMLYIDQPIGVGFSTGSSTVDSTTGAAKLIWNLIQAFYAKFPEYTSREFAIWTESYGGHYGPGFAKYILDQNKAIASGKINATKINFSALGINNAWVNPYDAYKGMIDFAANNSHKPLISSTTAGRYTQLLEQSCAPALKKCWADSTDASCRSAMNTCKIGIESPISMAGDFDVYDVRKGRRGKWPPQTYEKWLQQPAVQTMIGAKQKYNECPRQIQARFQSTGDDSRNFLGALEEVVNSGAQVLVWAGDSDWICNWMGNFYTANDVKYPGQAEFKSRALQPYKVNGKEKGSFKTVKNLAFLRVYNAGHTVPAYQPEIALQAFVQTMKKEPLSST
ncbi:putative carboxypeptidase S1 [Microthyrium microscopicum]|uniref:Carboxypeptidase n=1 Tax=Microthyrium microscopicum TaxID=703497 RepID=A0A6A6U3S9_9PEZI|nr:putative carboxypeptidase S1 [Microthyrium microscopicum]